MVRKYPPFIDQWWATNVYNDNTVISSLFSHFLFDFSLLLTMISGTAIQINFLAHNFAMRFVVENKEKLCATDILSRRQLPN